RTAVIHEPPHVQLLRRVVDRQIRFGLKEPDLPDAVAGDAARGQVGDAAVRKPQPRVGDVDASGEHGYADGFDGVDVGLDDRQHDVEVVDHEIEDDVDVEAALGKRAEAVHFDEARI